MPININYRKLGWLALRVAVTVAVFVYLFSIVSFDELFDAFSRISIQTGIIALVLCYVGISMGAVRWYALFAVYGAPHRPAFLTLFRLHLVALFFNTFLPGAVGGDVVRGIATRESFGKDGTASSLTVVFVERIAGLVGLMILATIAFSLHPLPGVGGVAIWSTIGIMIAVSSIAIMAFGRRYADRFPGPISRLIAKFPEVKSVRPFILVITLSVMIHLMVSVVGHMLVLSIDERVMLQDSLVIIPCAIAATFFPLTVAGLGAREATFVFLYSKVNISEADALAASLSLLLLQMTMAASGGLLYLLIPLRDKNPQ